MCVRIIFSRISLVKPHLQQDALLQGGAVFAILKNYLSVSSFFIQLVGIVFNIIYTSNFNLSC